MTFKDDQVNWVYRCFDDSGYLLYVGCTHDLWKRLATHKTTAPWAPAVARVTAKVYPDGPTARRVEREAIATEVPRWNKIGKWAHRGRWSKRQWLDYLDVLTLGATTSTSTTLRDLERAALGFHATFGVSAPGPTLQALERLRERAKHARLDHAAFLRRRTEEIRREDELALARERRDNKKRTKRAVS